MKRTNECNMEKDKRMQYGKGIILESRMNVGKGLIRHVRIYGTRSIKSVVIGCKLNLIQCNFWKQRIWSEKRSAGSLLKWSTQESPFFKVE